VLLTKYLYLFIYTHNGDGTFQKTDDELQLMYRKTKHCNNNKSKRLDWAGHVVRIADDRTVKKRISGEIRRKKKSMKAKIKVTGQYCE